MKLHASHQKKTELTVIFHAGQWFARETTNCRTGWNL